GDVHGTGDVHELDVIGWATVFSESPNRAPTLTLLLQNGARHHIFSAIALGDLDLIRQVIADDPKALHRRLSRYEQGQTPVHFAITRKRYDILDVLIALGADLEAPDWNGQTALAVAIMRHDREAIERLTAAGARQPSPIAASEYKSRIAKAAGSTRKGAPMINVPDVAAALDWYTSIGFTEVGRYADDGVVNWGMVSFGNAELMLSMHGKSGQHDASLWFYIDDAEELYKLLKSRQLEAAQASLAGKKDVPGQIEFAQELYDPPYGGREFGILDLNGYDLRFLQERS
ncbi:MAG: ankyrin repeat domain-containing protein, partial [Gemmatimonadaceae bacterium]